MVLTNTSLELARGETTSLVGVSGSGKSTLLGLIAGLMQPDSGRIVIDGQDITRLDDRGRARLRARRVGVVLQSGNLIPFLTALENVELAIRLPAAAEPPGVLGTCCPNLGWLGGCTICLAGCRAARPSGSRRPSRWPISPICFWRTK